jgi:hypothetical protein
VLSVKSILRLKLLDRVRVVQEENLCLFIMSASSLFFSRLMIAKNPTTTYSTMTSFKPIKPLLSLGELILGNLRLQNLLDHLPKQLVLVIEQHDNTDGLRVEARRDVQHVVFGNLLDTSIRNGDLVGELVDAATVLAGLEKVHG